MPRHRSFHPSIDPPVPQSTPLVGCVRPSFPLTAKPGTISQLSALNSQLTPPVRHFVPLFANNKACTELNQLRLSHLHSKNPRNIKISNLSPKPPATPRIPPETPGTRLFPNSRAYPSDGSFCPTLPCPLKIPWSPRTPLQFPSPLPHHSTTPPLHHSITPSFFPF